MKEKIIRITFCSLFILIIFVMAIITITNNNELSKKEGRRLTQFPKTTIKSVLNTEYYTELTNAFSEESMRQMAIQMLMGNNYRLITENNTKSKLTLTYLWLTDVIENAKNEFGNNWRTAIVDDLSNIRHRTDEQNNLLFSWSKCRQNLHKLFFKHHN